MSATASLYERISQDKLYVKVAEKVQSLIIRNELHPGDRLPPERELAERLGVSRTVVREAIKVLQERGLVQIVSGRGTFVTDLATDRVYNSISLVFQMQSNSFDDLHEIRESLEMNIVGSAAERATPEDIEKLRAAIEAMDQGIESPEEYVKADLEFHSVLAQATQNPMYLALINPIIDLLREARLLIFSVPGAPHRGQDGHRAILACVERGDKEGAQEAMRRHLSRSREDLRVAMAKADLVSP